MSSKNPYLALDDDALGILTQLKMTPHAALAVTGPGGAPSVTRIALACLDLGASGFVSAPMLGATLVTLISDLSMHTKALRAAPACALLIGEPGQKGDPLTHPRLTLHCEAEFVEQKSDAHALLRAQYLEQRPKAKLYVDFADFHFVRFAVKDGLLNAGFGKAYKL